MTKAYKVELLIIDYEDELNEEEITDILEQEQYPNHCISPQVKNIIYKDIGGWHDDHPLNEINNDEYYNKLFNEGK